jgi:hypothetical protein
MMLGILDEGRLMAGSTGQESSNIIYKDSKGQESKEIHHQQPRLSAVLVVV